MVVPAEIMASGFMDSRAMDISEAPLGPASAAETSHLIDSEEMPLISAQSELALFATVGCGHGTGSPNYQPYLCARSYGSECIRLRLPDLLCRSLQVLYASGSRRADVCRSVLALHRFHQRGPAPGEMSRAALIAVLQSNGIGEIDSATGTLN